VKIVIRHTTGEATLTLDETQGAIGWHDLGTYRFNAGNTGRAVLSATGDGLVVADAFKWVSTARYNDDRLVSKIDLQPQDAIILLKTEEIHASYLPLIARQ